MEYYIIYLGYGDLNILLTININIINPSKFYNL